MFLFLPSGASCFFQLCPQVLDRRGITGGMCGKVRSAFVEFEDSEDGIWVNDSESSGTS